jgi:hypothetical protein
VEKAHVRKQMSGLVQRQSLEQLLAERARGHHQHRQASAQARQKSRLVERGHLARGVVRVQHVCASQQRRAQLHSRAQEPRGERLHYDQRVYGAELDGPRHRATAHGRDRDRDRNRSPSHSSSRSHGVSVFAQQRRCGRARRAHARVRFPQSGHLAQPLALAPEHRPHRRRGLEPQNQILAPKGPALLWPLLLRKLNALCVRRFGRVSWFGQIGVVRWTMLALARQRDGDCCGPR